MIKRRLNGSPLPLILRKSQCFTHLLKSTNRYLSEDLLSQERIAAFVDHLIQPIAQLQASYLKDATDFINFIERIKLPKSAILVSMDVTSLYSNIPQQEGITTVCHAYEEFYQGNPPVPTRFLSEMLSLILLENSFQFNEKDYLQTHGTSMGTKMAVSLC